MNCNVLGQLHYSPDGHGMEPHAVEILQYFTKPQHTIVLIFASQAFLNFTIYVLHTGFTGSMGPPYTCMNGIICLNPVRIYTGVRTIVPSKN